jgi:hypothetical protein
MYYYNPTEAKKTEIIMKTVYARVSEISGKILINDQLSGTALKCSDDDFMTIYRCGYIASLDEVCFSGDFIIENGFLTLITPSDESEF